MSDPWLTIVVKADPTDLWREAEGKVACTCGLIAVGYRASWAISHAEKCPVTAVYRMLVIREAQR